MFRWLSRKKGQPAEPQRIALPIEDDLSDLAARMLAFVAELEHVHESAQAALPYAVEEADKSRHVDRKARFVSYRDVLHSSILQLCGSIERLRSAHELCAGLEQALRSGHFDSTTGQTEIIAIRRVIQSLEREESIDEIWLRGVRSIKKEFDGVLRERDRENAKQKRKRLGFKTEWETAKAAKERMPKGTGHRDSWNPYE